MVVKTYLFDFIINTLDFIINQINIPQYYWFDYYTNLKESLNNYIDTYFYSKNYMCYIASDIYDRRKSISTIVNDIGDI